MKPLATLAVLLLALPVMADETDLAASITALTAAARQGHDAASASAQAPAAAAIDLSGQFPPRTGNRNQKDVGDCHDFAVTALLDAAYFRQYGAAAGAARTQGRMEFSQADIFIQNTMLHQDENINNLQQRASATPVVLGYYSDYMASGGTRKTDVPTEGGSLTYDTLFALMHGLATEDALPYARFLTEYEKERAALKSDMNRADGNAAEQNRKNNVDPNQPLVLHNDLGQGNFGTTVAEARREEAVQLGIGDRQNDRIARFLAGLERANPGRIAQERADSMDRMSSFQIANWAQKTPLTAAVWKLSAQDCAAQSGDRIDFLMAQLGKGLPVAIAFDLAGLPGWGFEKATQTTGHGVVIVGFRYASGRAQFTTLNSWGPGHDYPFPLDQLCRISEMVSIATPSDAR